LQTTYHRVIVGKDMTFRRLASRLMWLIPVGLIVVVFALPEYWPDYGSIEQAILQGDAGKAKMYLDRGVDPNIRSRWRSELRDGIRYRRHLPELSDAEEPLLSLSIHKRQLQIARILIAAGADPNDSDGDGDTPLVHAAVSDDSELVKMLLERGANPITKVRDGGTALWEPDPNRGRRYRPAHPEIIRLLEQAQRKRQ